MSFPISIKNVPAETAFWKPAVYEGVNIYYPSDYLTPSQKWTCPLFAGAGITVDIRAVVYDSSYNILSTKDLYEVVVKDGQEFVFNWGGGLGSFAIPAVLGGLLVLALIMGKRG